MKAIITYALLLSIHFLAFGQNDPSSNEHIPEDSTKNIVVQAEIEYNSSDRISVFSNQEKLFVRNNSNELIKTLEIFDTRSRQVHETKNPMDSLFEVSLKQNNVYIIHIIFENGTYHSVKSIH